MIIISISVASVLVLEICDAFSVQKIAPMRRRQSEFPSFATTSDSLSSYSSSLLASKISFELHPSISGIPAEDWNSCLTPDSSPFLDHAWLRCLEESGCASAETGWAPQHLSIQIDGKQKGYVPLYIKGHSMGEFIFDHSWAEAAHQSGITYYPKLLVAVPFTPATGQRILFKPDVWKRSGQEIRQIRKAVANFLIQVAESNHLSSVHFNFVTEEEATDLSGSSLALKTEAGDDTKNGKNDKSLQLTTKVQEMLERISPRGTYLRRTSLQYHWTNANPNNHDQPYTNFDEYLACFKSKRRITIRRERQRVLEEQEVRIDAVVGNDIRKYPGLVERMFDIYLSTVDKMIWGRQYLTLEFFQLLVDSTFVDRLCFLCVRPKSSGILLKANDVFAGTFNIVQNGVFYGRYWGCLPGREIKNLHFETCYWSAIDFCIRSGIQRMEPGAGGGDYKWARGFDPALIHSTHYICHPGLRRAVSQFLEYETENNVELTEYLSLKSAVKSKVVAAKLKEN